MRSRQVREFHAHDRRLQQRSRGRSEDRDSDDSAEAVPLGGAATRFSGGRTAAGRLGGRGAGPRGRDSRMTARTGLGRKRRKHGTQFPIINVPPDLAIVLRIVFVALALLAVIALGLVYPALARGR